jgi:hypothetical protein
LLIGRAEALGEPLEDPLVLFSVLYGFWVVNFLKFNGDVVHQLAAQFLALAEKQKATVPLMIAHRLLGISYRIEYWPGYPGGNITPLCPHTKRGPVPRAASFY